MLAALGLGGHRPRDETAADGRRRRPHAGHGATRGPSGGAGVGPRLRPAVSHRWVQRVSDCLTDALWALGAAAAATGHRPGAETALDAAAAAALCAGHQDRPPAAPGTSEPPCGI